MLPSYAPKSASLCPSTYSEQRPQRVLWSVRLQEKRAVSVTISSVLLKTLSKLTLLFSWLITGIVIEIKEERVPDDPTVW
jgi:hypothetical protein